ncbi:MAG: ribosomal protein S18 acetylase RimI-like enzyme [Arenicella sp.]
MTDLLETAQVRAMYMSDTASVIEIISDHDEDDGDAAEAEFQDEGVEGQFVLVDNDTVLGITGYREVVNCDATFYLSWTYLDQQYRGRGLGKKMLGNVLDRLRDQDARKIFVKVSDYQQDGVNVYAAALSMYKSFGFKVEVVGEDFYDQGEAQTILGLEFKPQSDDVMVADEKPVIRFNGLFEIAETDGAYTFEWIVEKSAGFFGKRSFTPEDLEVGLRSVKEQGGRKIFLTFPSNLVLIHRPLQAVGFKYVGQLKDYYEEGLHESHFSHDLEGLGQT